MSEGNSYDKNLFVFGIPDRQRGDKCFTPGLTIIRVPAAVAPKPGPGLKMVYTSLEDS